MNAWRGVSVRVFHWPYLGGGKSQSHLRKIRREERARREVALVALMKQAQELDMGYAAELAELPPVNHSTPGD